MMKCENCPFYGLEGMQNDMSWCKLYNAEAPVQDCEGERDTFLRHQELMFGHLEKEE
jgi:hypothetical protein